jgi:hypothetical protein
MDPTVAGASCELEASSADAYPDEPTVRAYFDELCTRAHTAVLASDIDPGEVVLTLTGYGKSPDGRSLQPEVQRFPLTDHNGLAQAALAWTRQAHRNVYVGLHLMPNTLKGRQRGGEVEHVATLGLVADLDGDKGNVFEPSSFSVPPTVTTVSSRIPTINRQPAWWFTRAVSAD